MRENDAAVLINKIIGTGVFARNSEHEGFRQILHHEHRLEIPVDVALVSAPAAQRC